MKMRIASLALLSAAATMSSGVNAIAKPGQLPGKPRFVVLPNNAPGHVAPVHPAGAPAVQLSQWNGSFTDRTGSRVSFTMVGPSPATSNSTTTIPVFVIPVKVVFGVDNGSTTFDPKRHLVGTTGKDVVTMALASPVFKARTGFTSGNIKLGKTQYIDAYQRGNFWSSVKTNTSYHVVLGSPTALKTLTVPVPVGVGQIEHFNDDGVAVAVVNIDEFDAALQAYMTAHPEITPAALPIFITYNTYLEQNHDSNECCIGGYHSANGAQPGGQTYAYSTFVDDPGHFSQDVAALSHEVGEWMDDPFVDNFVNCSDNSLLENGDPLEGDTNFGAYPYVAANGFTYNLQSLVYLPYFGASKKKSANGWFSLMGKPSQDPASHDSVTGVCPGPQSP